MLYKTTAPYSPAHNRGLAWDDPDLGIDWRIRSEFLLSDRDPRWPRLRDVTDAFA